MDTNYDKIDELVSKLRAERDELRVKLHLGGMEAREEWEELEKKWHRLESKIGHAKEDIAEKSREVGEGAEVVADEIKSAYRRIRERLSGDE